MLTLEGARQALRRLRATEGGQRAARVVLDDGIYFLDAPLILDPADGGSPGCPVTWEAGPGARPLLSGGRPLRGWRKDGRGWWRLHLPAVERGEWAFDQLFVNGERRARPRLPLTGSYRVERELPPRDGGTGPAERFGFFPGDLRADWANVRDIELVCFFAWRVGRFGIDGIDEVDRIVDLKGKLEETGWAGRLSPWVRYVVENVREALGRPGDWYLDRISGELTYVPLPHEDPDTAVVIAPHLERLLALEGQSGHERGAICNVRFRGLSFAHTSCRSRSGRMSLQAAAEVGSALAARHARDCVFEGCSVAHVGGFGLELGAGCVGNSIVGCALADLGGGGIKVGETTYPAHAGANSEDNLVRDCRIGSGGWLSPGAVGIWVGQAARCRLERNDIFGFSYSGISVGWTWGYGPSAARGHAIVGNHVHDVGHGLLSDVAGIYAVGAMPGTVISGNRIHGVDAADYGGWGIYLDEGATGIVVKENLVYDTKGAGFHQHFGTGNLIERNIFAFGREALVQRSVGAGNRFAFVRNLVVGRGAQILAGAWRDEDVLMKGNVYWETGCDQRQPEQGPLWAGLPWRRWRTRGRDRWSLVADPRFRDPERGDFCPGNLAVVARLGLWCVGSRGARAISVPLRALPCEATLRPTLRREAVVRPRLADVAVGDRLREAITIEEVGGGTARVADSPRTGDGRCIGFADSPTKVQPYNPHLVIVPSFANAPLLASFDLWGTPEAVMLHQWRDIYPPTHRVGPTLWIAEGWVLVGGQRIARLPLDGWARFLIHCWGHQRPGRYDLAICSEGESPVLFAEQECDPEFELLRWWGWAAHGKREASFYLQNLYLAEYDAETWARLQEGPVARPTASGVRTGDSNPVSLTG